MKSELPSRILLAAKTLARLEYQLSHARACLWVNRSQLGGSDAVGVRHLRVLRLKRDLAEAELERLKNEFRLAINDLSMVNIKRGTVRVGGRRVDITQVELEAEEVKAKRDEHKTARP